MRGLYWGMMNRLKRVFVLVGLLGVAVCDARQPNIVLIYADDLGFKDVGYQSEGKFKTPVLDRLTKEGMVFTDGYSNAANCQPARACLLSGNYGGRHHVFAVQSTSRGPKNKMRLIPIPNRDGLADDDETIADVLRAAGYATGHFGKWHLYDAKGKRGGGTLPTKQGFDVSYDSFGNGELPEGAKGNKTGPKSDPKGVFDLSKQACDFMEKQKGEGKPFFVYLSHHAPHGPYQARESTRKEIKDLYTACVYDLDASVGRVVDKVKELGLEKETLILFTSDNGGAGSQEPLRGNKGSYYEGGIREPMVAVWPGVIEAGSRCGVPVIQVDLMPTFTEMARAKKVKDVVDGESLVGLFKGEKKLKRESIFWHMPGYLNKPVTRGRDEIFRTRPVSVIRKGKWKLHLYLEEWVLDGGAASVATNNAVELYDLESDLGERENLANGMPEVRDALIKELEEWQVATGAPIPRERNPKYNADAPVEGKKSKKGK